MGTTTTAMGLERFYLKACRMDRNVHITHLSITHLSITHLSISREELFAIGEGSPCIYLCLRKFHQYLHGTRFTITTDHKPLVGLFNEQKGIPVTAAQRIRRWALTLAAYEYTIQYKAGRENGNADGLSPIPVAETVPRVPVVGSTELSLAYLESTPVTSSKIKEATRKDSMLSIVMNYIYNGMDGQNNSMQKK